MSPLLIYISPLMIELETAISGSHKIPNPTQGSPDNQQLNQTLVEAVQNVLTSEAPGKMLTENWSWRIDSAEQKKWMDVQTQRFQKTHWLYNMASSQIHLFLCRSIALNFRIRFRCETNRTSELTCALQWQKTHPDWKDLKMLSKYVVPHLQLLQASILQQEERLTLLKGWVMTWNLRRINFMSILRGRGGTVKLSPRFKFNKLRSYSGGNLTRIMLNKGFAVRRLKHAV